jgi:multicomponent Na+:H+ antiporter subunit F
MLSKSIALFIVAAALGAVAYRLLAGPSSADRIIATDMLSLLAICLAALVAGMTGYQAFLDVAFGIALFGFLAAVAFGALLERASLKEPAE